MDIISDLLGLLRDNFAAILLVLMVLAILEVAVSVLDKKDRVIIINRGAYVTDCNRADATLS
jgi:hypothetical protein